MHAAYSPFLKGVRLAEFFAVTFALNFCPAQIGLAAHSPQIHLEYQDEQLRLLEAAWRMNEEVHGFRLYVVPALQITYGHSPSMHRPGPRYSASN